MNDCISTIAGCIIAGQLVTIHAAALFHQSSIYPKADLRTVVTLRALIPWHHYTPVMSVQENDKP